MIGRIYYTGSSSVNFWVSSWALQAVHYPRLTPFSQNWLVLPASLKAKHHHFTATRHRHTRPLPQAEVPLIQLHGLIALIQRFAHLTNLTDFFQAITLAMCLKRLNHLPLWFRLISCSAQLFSHWRWSNDQTGGDYESVISLPMFLYPHHCTVVVGLSKRSSVETTVRVNPKQSLLSNCLVYVTRDLYMKHQTQTQIHNSCITCQYIKRIRSVNLHTGTETKQSKDVIY